jgi:uncharacterized protein YggT (Ycf19 family)
MSGTKIPRILQFFVNFAFGLAALALFIRFLFRLFGANIQAEVTQIIYESTSPLLDPFRGIFLPYVIEPGNVVEFSTIIAIIFYLLAAYLIIELIRFVSHQSEKFEST